MKNRKHFEVFTDRMQAFREETPDQKPYVNAERTAKEDDALYSAIVENAITPSTKLPDATCQIFHARL